VTFSGRKGSSLFCVAFDLRVEVFLTGDLLLLSTLLSGASTLRNFMYSPFNFPVLLVKPCFLLSASRRCISSSSWRLCRFRSSSSSACFKSCSCVKCIELDCLVSGCSSLSFAMSTSDILSSEFCLFLSAFWSFFESL